MENELFFSNPLEYQKWAVREQARRVEQQPHLHIPKTEATFTEPGVNTISDSSSLQEVAPLRSQGNEAVGTIGGALEGVAAVGLQLVNEGITLAAAKIEEKASEAQREQRLSEVRAALAEEIAKKQMIEPRAAA